MPVKRWTRRPRRGPAILDYCGGGLPLFWFSDGGVVPLAGGGPFGLGFVLGGGGGGFCSGAPPGWELGALLAGGVACSLAGGVFGVVVSLGDELAEPPLPELPPPPHAAAESESTATHSNNTLRFIWITSQRKSPDRGTVASRVPPQADRPAIARAGAAYFLAGARFLRLAGSLARDLPKEPR